MIKYNIEGGSLPVVICYPEAGQTLCTESGSMSWMSPNIDMQTNTGGGMKKVFGRLFSGEAIFMNEYTAVGGPGMIAFASSFPGRIIPYEVNEGNGIIVQKRGFLAMEKGLDLSVYFQHKLGGGFFGGEGFIMQKMFFKWLKAAGIRAVKTIAQTALATIGTTMIASAVDWKFVISASLLSGGISLLTSVAGLPEVKIGE